MAQQNSAITRDNEALPRFHTYPAILPSTGRRIWLVLDRDQGDAITRAPRDFAMFLSGADRSENTIRAYIPRVAEFFNWANENGVDWRNITLPQMARFKWSLEATPALLAGQASRSPRTINLILTAVLEFLRYCARQGSIEPEVVERLIEPKFIAHAPSGFDPGENGQFRFTRRKEIRAREVHGPPKKLTQDQVEMVMSAASNARDRFLFVLLDATAVRIGEALGLRRSDMHFLPDSTALGCEIRGSHVHVIRRNDNANGMLAKSRPPRHIPVLEHVTAAYRSYQVLRDDLANAVNSDHVFVNVGGGDLGAAMTYSATIGLVKRVGRRAGVPELHPHMFRHTTATRWVDAGVRPDVVQQLLGHASPASTAIYTHTSDAKLRDAVARGSERVVHSTKGYAR